MTEKQEATGVAQVEQRVADKVGAMLGEPDKITPATTEAAQASERPNEFEIDLGGAKRKVSLDEVTTLFSERDKLAQDRAAIEAARKELSELLKNQKPKEAPQKPEFDFDDEEPEEPRQPRRPQADAVQALMGEVENLKRQLEPLRVERLEQAKTSYVTTALGKFPVFQEDPEMRSFAERAVYDAMTANPTADIEKVVAEYAAMSHKILSKRQPSATSPDPRGRSEVLQAPVESTFANLEAGAIREQFNRKLEDIMRRR